MPTLLAHREQFALFLSIYDEQLQLKLRNSGRFYTNMKYRLKTFGITRDILGGKEVDFEMSGTRVKELRGELLDRFPEMKSLNSLLIAVNNSYAEDDLTLAESDEIALIPPVSGG